jgi:hypothetical protein
MIQARECARLWVQLPALKQEGEGRSQGRWEGERVGGGEKKEGGGEREEGNEKKGRRERGREGGREGGKEGGREGGRDRGKLRRSSTIGNDNK